MVAFAEWRVKMAVSRIFPYQLFDLDLLARLQYRQAGLFNQRRSIEINDETSSEQFGYRNGFAWAELETGGAFR